MKKMAMLLLLLCFLTSCPLVVSKVGYYIDNKSNDTIVVDLLLGGYDNPAYPDTILSSIDLYTERVAPKEKKRDSYTGYSFEDFFKRQFRNDTACVAIISADTIRKYGWEDVRANHRVLVRYDLSYHDFMELGLVVPYPPTPQMAQMKMYPPYSVARRGGIK